MKLREYIHLLDILKEHEYALKDDLKSFHKDLHDLQEQKNENPYNELLDEQIRNCNIEIKTLNSKIKSISDMMKTINEMEIR